MRSTIKRRWFSLLRVSITLILCWELLAKNSTRSNYQVMKISLKRVCGGNKVKIDSHSPIVECDQNQCEFKCDGYFDMVNALYNKYRTLLKSYKRDKIRIYFIDKIQSFKELFQMLFGVLFLLQR